ncbi:hypothetical protein BG000_005200 [Podila horticola]|nr:hypothetical protein BG000_005200 [Podila horticola]
MPPTRRSQLSRTANQPLFNTTTTARGDQPKVGVNTCATRNTRSQTAHNSNSEATHNSNSDSTRNIRSQATRNTRSQATRNTHTQHKSNESSVDEAHNKTRNNKKKRQAITIEEEEEEGHGILEAHIFEEDGEWGGIIDRTPSPDIDPALRAELDAEYAEMERNIAQEAALERQQVADVSRNLQRKPPPGSPSEHSDDEEPNYTTCALPDMYDILLEFRAGAKDKGSNRKIAALPAVPFKIQPRVETYNLFIGRVVSLASSLTGYAFPEDARPYLAPTKTTPQRDFTELTDLNFLQMFERVWRKEAKKKRDLSGTGIVMRIFAFLEKKARPNATNSNDVIRRVTARRLVELNEVVGEAIQQNVIPQVGNFTRVNLNRHFASRGTVPAIADIAIPSSNTFRQSGHLDREREAFDTLTEDETRAYQAETRPVRITGVLHLNISDLRKALNLPHFDLNGMHTFDFPEVNNPAEDIEDVDNEPDSD